tara:strand:- start:2343 stop:2831 length:489 start_codon:yes stop_codon:yes gene_type:complete
MKITKQRLKEIIKEEFGRSSWLAPYKLKDADGPFVLSIPSRDPHERYFRILRRDEGGSPHPHFSPRRAAHQYTSIDKALDRQGWLENYGLDQVEIEAVNAPALEEGAEPIHKIVSRDGKKKGVKVSGNWKDPSIKVKWLDAEGKGFGETVSVKTQNYDRKKW